MMKKYLVLGIVCLISTTTLGQKIKFDFSNEKEVDERVSPVVKEKVEQYALEVREIVVAEKLAMEREISKVNEDLNKAIISAEEANNLKATIALRFSDQINARIENLKFNLDEITKQQVQYSILNTDLEQIKEEKTAYEKTYRPVNQITGYFGYGIISLSDGTNEKLNNHLGFSSGIDAGFIFHRQFSKTSPLTFKSGIYFSWRTLRFEDDNYTSRDAEGVVGLHHYDTYLDKSKLRATYLIVPVGINYNFSKLKHDDAGNTYRNIEKGFGISANVYGGFNISNNNIVKGENINWRHRKPSFNLNEFVYGAQLTLSYNSLNFFVRQELNPYFKSNTFDDRKMLQFGISTGF